jgi:EmrB/QacA subfamily drug resistance transporter
MSRVFPPEKQGMAMGLFGIFVVMAPAIGPYLGGLLVDAFNWRYAFLAPLPMSALGILLTAKFLPERDSTESRTRLDLLSVCLLTTAIFILLIGLSKGQSKGWGSNFSLVCFVVFLLSSAGFIWQQKISKAPLLDLSLFAYQGFTPAAIVAAVFGAGLYSSFYLAPLFLQNIQGLNATTAGLVLLPGGIMLGLFLPVSGRLADKISPRLLIACGIFLFAYSSWLMASADRLTGFMTFIWWVIIGRVGMAFIMPPLTVASFRHLPASKLSQGSGAPNFVRQFGGALGVNVSAIYLERQTSIHMSHISAGQNESNSVSVNTVRDLFPYLQEAGIDQVQQIPVAVWYMMREFYRQAASLAFQDTFAITAFLFTLLIIPTYYLARDSK